MSSTRQEHAGDNYLVTIQHCEADGCDVYLGVNYPDFFCKKHRTRQEDPT